MRKAFGLVVILVSLYQTYEEFRPAGQDPDEDESECEEKDKEQNVESLIAELMSFSWHIAQGMVRFVIECINELVAFQFL